MRRLLSILLLLTAFLAFTPPAFAALIIVPDDAPTIQIAITTAASGDSILVRAGTYAESLTLTGKDLTIFGESGAEATAITGSSSFRILDVAGPDVTTATVLEDLTFRNGRAPQGAGIRLSSGASLTLQRCRFLHNEALGNLDNHVAGGAVLVGASSTLIAESCLFQDNQAAYLDLSGDASGGAIESSSGSRIEVRHSDFINNSTSGFEGGLGGGINVHGSAVVEDCRFSQGSGSEGAGIRAGIIFGDERDSEQNPSAMTYAELVVRRCVFDQNWVTLFGAAGIHCRYATVTIENNIFFDNFGPALKASNSQGTIANNTMSFNGAGISLEMWKQVPLLVSNNIVSDNYVVGVTVEGTPAPGTLACNDVWANQDGNYSGIPDPTGTNGNIAADPLFCDAAARDFTLNAQSPCAPLNSPAGCGLIGAWPVACGVADVASDDAQSVTPHLSVIPNPVHSVAELAFEGAGRRVLDIFDSQGRLVDRLTSSDGRWVWTPGASAPAGVYFARLDGGAARDTVKFLYLR